MQKDAKVIISKSRRRKLLKKAGEIFLLLVLVWVFFNVLERALCRISISQIEQSTNIDIDYSSIELSLKGTVLVKDLVICPGQESSALPVQEQQTSQSSFADGAILEAGSAYVRFSIASLLKLKPQVERVNINNFVFDAQFDTDSGRWNLGRINIKSTEKGSGPTPKINLQSGILRYTKITEGAARVACEIPIDAEFAFDEESGEGYKFLITTASTETAGKSELHGSWYPGTVTLAGGISSEDIPGMENVWSVPVLAVLIEYDEKENFTVDLRASEVYSKRSFAQGPVKIDQPFLMKNSKAVVTAEKFFRRYRPAGKVDIELNSSGNLSNLKAAKISGTVNCSDVTIVKDNFPYVMNKIHGPIRFTENSIILDGLRGRHNKVELVFNGLLKDFGPEFNYDIHVSSESMLVDDDLYRALPEKFQKVWQMFSPSGIAAFDFQFARTGPTDKSRTLYVKAKAVDAVYDKFPYPLKNVSGKLVMGRDETVFENLTSIVDDRQIVLNGKVTYADNKLASYDVNIEADNVVLDKTLERTLEKTVWSDYKRYITPNTQATAKLDTQLHIFRDLGRDEQANYQGSLFVDDIPLSENYLSTLSLKVRRIVDQFGPRGFVALSLAVDSSFGDRAFDKIDVYPRDVSVIYEKFPYPLRNVNGHIVVRPEKIILDNITAMPAESIHTTDDKFSVVIDGDIEYTGGEFERADMKIKARDVLMDEKLMLSLPENLGEYYGCLDATGRVDVDLQSFKVTKQADMNNLFDFAGVIKVKNASFPVGPEISEFFAEIQTAGQYSQSLGLTKLNNIINASQMRIQNKQLTNLDAELIYNPDNKSFAAEEFTADMYDGRVAGDLAISQSSSGLVYSLNTGFDKINLHQFLADTDPDGVFDDTGTRGNMDGSLIIEGPFADRNSMMGSCKLNISDMQFGKLSVLSKVFLVLQLNIPADYAFENMIVDSFIKKDKILISNVDISGSNLAFKGSGIIDTDDKQIDLTLYARGERLARLGPNLLQSLTDTLGKAVLKIEVKGNYDNPTITRKTLPVVGDVLKIFGTKPQSP